MAVTQRVKEVIVSLNTPITFQTTDGQTITVRRMLPADVNQLVHIYRHLSEESLYQRFREPVSKLPPMRILEEARALAEAGYRQGKGFLAFADLPGQPGTPVAGARYIRVGEDAAETAITIRDDFQKKGIGTQLLNILIAEARKEGIRTLIANVSANNRAVIKLLSRYPFPQRREHYGPEISIEFDISQEPVNQPDELVRKAMALSLKRQIPPTRSAKTASFAPRGRK